MVFCTAVLTLEAFVVLFATLVAFGLRVAEPALVWSVGGAGVVLCLLAADRARRGGALILGSVVQAVLLASGIVVGMMFIVGGVFAVIWVVALALGRRIDTERAQRAAAEASGGGQGPATA